MTQSTPLRFGFHDFLNAQPLLVPLKRLAKKANLEMILDVPSALAGRFKAGELDLAMIPSIEYLRNAGVYRLLPALSISSRGPVSTVLLISKTPLLEIRSLAVDNRSLTSVALLRILYGDSFADHVEMRTVGPDLATMMENHDAALLIGDQALKAERASTWQVHDLSQAWFQQTGKTFVHAVVAVRGGVNLTEETCDLILQAKHQGMAEMDAIIRSSAELYGVDENVCADYLRSKVRYDLAEEEVEGLIRFRDLCHEHGLIDEIHPVTFYHNPENG